MNEAMDQTALLVSLCIKVLKNSSPKGMTTKELAAALDYEQTEGFNGISSSILSSKLNAVFRRMHNDSPRPSQEQLTNLPLTRNPSSDVPRRLVYRYTPPETTTNSDIINEEDESEEISSSDEQNEPRTPRDSSDNEDIDLSKKRKQNFSNENTSNRKSKIRRTEEANSNTTSKVEPYKWKPYESMQLKYTPPKVNLYYDTIGYDTLTSALNEKSLTYVSKEQDELKKPVSEIEAPSGSDWDFQRPESFTLNDIDSFVI